MLAADIPASRRIPYSTSGSTGVPFQFWVSRALNGSKIARYLREMSAWGIEPGTPFLKVWGAGRVPAPGRETEQAFFTQRLLRRREALAFDLDEEKALLLLEALREGRLKVLEAYASTALFLARIAKVKGLSFPQLKAVVVSGETLAHGQAQFLAETFGARVVNAYGSREFGRVAFSCPEGDGLFFSMECFFAEYLDLDPPDPSGLKRLVLTCFSNETQPFIRYDTGDLVEPDDPGTTLGGRGLEVWKRVEGRLAERVVTPAGRQLSVHYFTLLFEDLQDAVRQFQVVADQPGHLSLWIVPGPSFDETLGKNLCARILEHAGPGMSVDIKTMGAIPVSGDGKRPLLRNLA
jgi:phenylacetate-CoA ligase